MPLQIDFGGNDVHAATPYVYLVQCLIHLPPPNPPSRALLGSIPFVYMLIRAELFQQLYRRIHFRRASIKNDNEYGKWKSILSSTLFDLALSFVVPQLCLPLSLTNFAEQKKKKKRKEKKEFSTGKSLLILPRWKSIGKLCRLAKEERNWNIWKIWELQLRLSRLRLDPTILHLYKTLWQIKSLFVNYDIEGWGLQRDETQSWLWHCIYATHATS